MLFCLVIQFCEKMMYIFTFFYMVTVLYVIDIAIYCSFVLLQYGMSMYLFLFFKIKWSVLTVNKHFLLSKNILFCFTAWDVSDLLASCLCTSTV